MPLGFPGPFAAARRSRGPLAHDGDRLTFRCPCSTRSCASTRPRTGACGATSITGTCTASAWDRLLHDARSAVHVGAGGVDPATLTSADLSKLRIYAVDPSIESLRRSPNPHRLVAWGHEIPLPGESTDVVFSEFVMEHVEKPGETVREAHRLLRPGGHLILDRSRTCGLMRGSPRT